MGLGLLIFLLVSDCRDELEKVSQAWQPHPLRELRSDRGWRDLNWRLSDVQALAARLRLRLTTKIPGEIWLGLEFLIREFHSPELLQAVRSNKDHLLFRNLPASQFLQLAEALGSLIRIKRERDLSLHLTENFSRIRSYLMSEKAISAKRPAIPQTFFDDFTLAARFAESGFDVLAIHRSLMWQDGKQHYHFEFDLLLVDPETGHIIIVETKRRFAEDKLHTLLNRLRPLKNQTILGKKVGKIFLLEVDTSEDSNNRLEIISQTDSEFFSFVQVDIQREVGPWR